MGADVGARRFDTGPGRTCRPGRARRATRPGLGAGTGDLRVAEQWDAPLHQVCRDCRDQRDPRRPVTHEHNHGSHELRLVGLSHLDQRRRE
jgi:hypothetical protein